MYFKQLLIMTEHEYISLRLKRDFIKYVLLQEPRYDDREVSARLRLVFDSDSVYMALKDAIAVVTERHLSLERLKDENTGHVNELPDWLNPSLAEVIVADYRRSAAELIERHDFMPALLLQIDKLTWSQGVDDMARNLRQFLDDAELQSGMYVGMPRPDADAYDLDTTYQAAKRVTLRERVAGDNNRDILAFRSALLAYTRELCKVELYRALAGLYGRVLDSADLRRIISAFETAHACAAGELAALEAAEVNAEWEAVYRRRVPVDFYERNAEDITAAMAFHMIMFMAFARNEQYLLDEGILSAGGELTVFTSPRFDGRSWASYDFYKLLG